MDQTQTDYLSAASDLEDTDGEAFTDGEAYTDNEDLEEAYPGQDVSRRTQGTGAALARSSEPAFGHRSPTFEPEPSDDMSSSREIPPLMLVPEPRSSRREQYSPPHSPAEEDEPSHRSFTDSDFSALDAAAPKSPSDGPPDFVAPDPSTRYKVNEPKYAEEQLVNSEPASLSAIEDKLQQVCVSFSAAAPVLYIKGYTVITAMYVQPPVCIFSFF